MSKKAYLGDGVDIELDKRERLILTTNDGIKYTNTIVLEFDVIRSLIAYLKDNNLITG